MTPAEAWALTRAEIESNLAEEDRKLLPDLWAYVERRIASEARAGRWWLDLTRTLETARREVALAAEHSTVVHILAARAVREGYQVTRGIDKRPAWGDFEQIWILWLAAGEGPPRATEDNPLSRYLRDV